MTFYVGQKVVCVDSNETFCLVKEKIYVCTGFDNDGNISWTRVDCCSEHQSRASGWYSYRFRPIVDRKASVSFTMGADPESERYDNRKTKERVR